MALLLISRCGFRLRNGGTSADIPPVRRFQKSRLASSVSVRDGAPARIILLSADACCCRCSLRRHQIDTHPGCMAGDRLEIGGPFAKVFFRVVKDLAGLVTMLKGRACVTRNEWGIIQQVQ